MSSNFQSNARIAREALLAAWLEFCVLFPTTQSCVEYLFAAIEAEGLIACCSNKDLTRSVGDRFSYCTQCRQISWFTSGTLLDHVKNPRAWLATIWLMEKGLHASSKALAEVVGVAQSSALNIQKKIRAVISDNMGEGAATLPLGHFVKLICKRSRQTPAREHPNAELAEIESQTGAQTGHNDEQENDRLNGTLSERQKIVLSFLSKEPIHPDKLQELSGLPMPEVSVAITMIQLAGLAEQLTGDMHVRIDKNSTGLLPTISAELETSIKEAIVSLKETLHGCSAKAIQLFLADYWRTACKTAWNDNALLRACIRAEPITDKRIIADMAPPLVRFIAPVDCARLLDFSHLTN